MAAGRSLRLFASKALLTWVACLAGLALGDGIYWVPQHRLPDALTFRISIAGTAFVAIMGSVRAMRRTRRMQRRNQREPQEPR
ncbi:hypothetical protein [Streptomyces sp. NPDC058457]|uniref:hypothetical protein n=1 Tax=Streptomyces sp. NPDC058457 TaxID=3346507 RepID=UPI00365557EE